MKAISRSHQLVNALVLLAMAALVIAAISPWAAWDAGRAPSYYGWNLFSYFTVQSNLIASVVFVMAAIAIIRQKSYGGWFRYVRGGAVLYMLVTGVVYALLLHNNPEANPSLGLDWKNFVLHYLNPVFIVMWWLLWPSAKAVSVKGALWWLAFPILWIVYTLIRGAALDWYPYPFLNPETAGGWGGVTLYIIGIALAFVVLSQLLAWVSRERVRNNSLY